MSDGNNATRTQVVYVTTSVTLHDGTLIENLYLPAIGQCMLAVFRIGEVQTVKEYRDQASGIVYRPKCNDMIKHGRLLLPSEAKLMEIDPVALMKEVNRFIMSFVDLDPVFGMITARYVLMSWVYDDFETIPYLRIVGPFGVGKTRFLNVIAAVAHHTLRMGSGITPPGIFHLIDKHPGATLIIDEANFEGMTKNNPFVQILNGGNNRMGCTTRCIGQAFDARSYPTFGPKIIGANSFYEDGGLESRIITGNAFQSSRHDLPDELPPYFRWPEAEALRNKLLAFRLAYHDRVKNNPKPDMPDDFSPRLREIVGPLFRTTGEKSIQPDVLGFLKNVNYQQAVSNAQTEEAYAVNILDEKKKLGERSMPVGALSKELYDRHGVALTPRKVGGLVRTLGIPVKARSSSGISIDLTSPKIEELAKRYRLPDKLN